MAPPGSMACRLTLRSWRGFKVSAMGFGQGVPRDPINTFRASYKNRPGLPLMHAGSAAAPWLGSASAVGQPRCMSRVGAAGKTPLTKADIPSRGPLS
jgi:hypothetical protein